MRTLPLLIPTVMVVALAATLGCLSSSTTRNADLVQVWPPKESDDAESSAPSSPSARHALAQDRSIGDQPVGSAVIPAAEALKDSRLTKQQQQLLGEQLASWTEPRSGIAPSENNSNEAPPQQNLSSYYAGRLASAQSATPPNAAPVTTPLSAGPTETAAKPAVAPATQPASTNPTTPPAAEPADAAAASPASNAPPPDAAAAAAKPEANATAAATPAADAPKPEAAPMAESSDASESTASSAEDSSPAAADAENTADTAKASKPVAEAVSAAQDEVEAPGEWSKHLTASIESLERQLASGEMEHDERVRLESTLRLMYVAAGREDDALRPIETASTPDQEFWKQCAFGLLQLVSQNGPPVSSRRAKLALRPLRDALRQLSAMSPLDVRNLAICQKVESFGRYTEFTPYEFRPEQEVILYVEVSNFAVESKPEGYETEFHGSYQILDAAGRRVVDYDLMKDRQLCRNVRTDYFLPYRIYMPKNLEAGTYQLQVTIEDKKGEKFGQTPPVEFKISG